jgi:tRNA(adenine34) deaminase
MSGEWTSEDVGYMERALLEARVGASMGEVPVGAVLVRGGRVLATAHNLRESAGDPTAHAEMLALRRGAADVCGWRLDGAVMYVTLEPCPMCAGALWLARVSRLVYGAQDKKAGAAGTLYNVVADPRLNHRLQVEAGLLANPSSVLLRDFFAALRAARREEERDRKSGAGSMTRGVPGCW